MLITKIYESFDQLPTSYEEVFRKASSRSFYYSLPWFKNLTEHAISKHEKLRIYGVEESNGRPIAAFVMKHSSPAARKRLQSYDLMGLSNYYSSLYGPVLDWANGYSAEVLQKLVESILVDKYRWDTVDLHPLDVDAPIFRELSAAFRAAKMIPQAYFCFGNWYLPVSGRSYQEYFCSLSSSVRNTVKRKSKKLEREVKAQIVIVQDDSDLEAIVAAYTEVYSASWKVPEPFPFFIPELIKVCAAMGWLRLGLLYINDEPAAAQLWIVANGVASIYKLAYDERFVAFSPGTILTARLMEHVIDVDRVHEVDYLTGDDPYKKDWMSHRRERWGVRVFNPRTIKGLGAFLMHRGRGFLKQTFLNAPFPRSGP